MLRFIYVCMFLVAGALLTIAAQFLMDGVGAAREGVLARNNPQTIESSVARGEGVTFEDIYATAPAQPEAIISENMSAEELNMISTTAGSNDNFGAGFTNTAPKALADEPPAQPAVTPDATEQDAN